MFRKKQSSRKKGRKEETLSTEGRKKGERQLSKIFNKQKEIKKERKKIGKIKHDNDRWKEERKNEELKKERKKELFNEQKNGVDYIKTERKNEE